MQGFHYILPRFVQICEARKAEVVSSPCRIFTDQATCESRMRRLVGTLRFELLNLDKIKGSYIFLLFLKYLKSSKLF